MNKYFFLLLGSLCAITSAKAQNVPETISYQGTLTLNGTPLNHPEKQIEFRVYDAQSAGNLRYRQQNSVAVHEGRFTTTLGPIGADGNLLRQVIHSAPDLYVGMVILGDQDIVLNRRQRLVSTPYTLISTKSLDGNPTGTIKAYVGAVAPPGWLLCDGGAHLAQNYPELSNVLNANDAVFRVPDLRGRFIRGLDQSGTVDTQPNRQLRSSQEDTYQSHQHDFTVKQSDSFRSEGIGALINRVAQLSYTATTTTAGSEESRPKNIALNFIIKH